MNRPLIASSISTCLFVALLGGASSLLAGCGGGGGAGGGSGSSGSTVSSINTGSGSATSNSGSAAPSGSGTATKQESISYGADGTRGYLPVTIEQGAGGVVAYKALDSSAGVVMDAASAASVQVDAPANYADRAFVKWQRGGQDLSTSPSMTFTPSALPGSGALTAIYQSQSATNGAFAPNYTRSGFPSWDHFPVKVYLDSTTTPGTSQASITNGMDRWVKASGGVISYTLVTDPSQADITIGFGTTPTGLAGITSASWDGDNHLVSATITISPAALTGTPATIQDLNTIAAHEFGHSLGLVSDSDATAGHSTDPNDTMYPTGNAQIGLISARDINTVATNYVALFNGGQTRGAKVQGASRSAKFASGSLHHATID